MSIRFLQSLPVRLAGLILLLSGVVLLALTEINRRAVERILAEQARIQALQATVGIVNGLDETLGSAERLARTVARNLGARAATVSEIRRLAGNLLLDQEGIYGFTIAFEPGALGEGPEHFGVYAHRVRTAQRFSTLDLTAPGLSYWTRDWYREVVDKGVPVWSEPFFDRGGTNRNVVRVTVPIMRRIKGRREPVGVVAATIDLKWLRRLVNANAFSDTSYAIVFSHSGKLILHPNPHYVAVETMESLAELKRAPDLAVIRQRVLAGQQGALSYFDPIRQRRVHVDYMPTKVARWGVLIGYDEAEFLKPQRSFRKIAAMYLGAVLLLLGGIVIEVTRRALRPLAKLTASAVEIAECNLNCAIPEVTHNDEVGRLTQAFRTMRDALKAQHIERRWASQALEHQLKYNNLIIDSIGELVFVVTKGLNIARINPAVSRVAGYALKDVLKAPVVGVIHLDERGLLADSVKNGVRLEHQAATVVAKDGSQIPALLTLVPLRDGAQVVGAVATLRLASAPEGPGAEQAPK